MAGERPPAMTWFSRNYSLGSRTVSITWITPLPQSMSALTTLALLIFTSSVGIDRHALTLHGLRRFELHDVGRLHVAGHHVVGQNRYQLVLVLRLEQCLDGAGGQLREGFIRGREDGERPLALQSIHESGRFQAATSVLKEPAFTAVSTISMWVFCS